MLKRESFIDCLQHEIIFFLFTLFDFLLNDFDVVNASAVEVSPSSCSFSFRFWSTMMTDLEINERGKVSWPSIMITRKVEIKHSLMIYLVLVCICTHWAKNFLQFSLLIFTCCFFCDFCFLQSRVASPALISPPSSSGLGTGSGGVMIYFAQYKSWLWS